MRCLNLGCGRRWHPDWENVDFAASAPGVRAYDLRKGVPYSDASFDVVYHSHLLEHFSKGAAPVFLRECYRVLKPGGTVRVAVPDLERIVRGYLEALENAREGSPGWDANYEWMVLEMYDQAVREDPGGSFREYFMRDPIPNWEFVSARVGAEARAALDWFRSSAQETKRPLSSRLRYVALNPAKFLQHKISKMFLSREDYGALQIGRFRRGGGVHQWMYDAYSLARLLQAAGFCHPQRHGPTDSAIPNWADFHLDAAEDGSIYKPDSLWMEASTP